MKKNAFLTFIFACIPGAGQMYYGYMKRGTSLLVYFCLFIMLGTIISPLVVGVAVVYMFSFFDTYDLIRYLVAGDPKPDGFLLPPDWQNQLGGAKTKMTPKMNKIIGWCLLLTGVYVMYDSVVWPIVSNILQQLGVYWDIIYTLNNAIPSVVLALLQVAADEENARWGSNAIRVEIKLVGDRPAGQQSPDLPIVQAAWAASEAVAVPPEFGPASSTDANLPMSLGIPAIRLCGGGAEGNNHSLDEWYDPANAYRGPQKVFLTLLGLVGVAGVSEPLLAKRG